MAPRIRFALVALVATLSRISPAQTPAHDSPAAEPLRHFENFFSGAEIPAGPAALEQGRKLFETHCAPCHGPRGEGGKGPTLAQPTLPRASDDTSLLRIIRGGIDGTEMPRARLERDETALIAAFVKSLGSKPPESVAGNPQRGAEIYATKGVCAQCHMIRGTGGSFGPDLTEVGRRRSAAYIRRALVEPGADVPQSYSPFRQDVPLPENFLYVRAVTREGTAVEGIRANEDTFSIQIRQVSGRVYSFFKADLAELHKDYGKSPMPAYGEALTKDELNDVVAFLVSLRGQK